METAATPVARRSSAPLSAAIAAAFLVLATIFAASTSWYIAFKTVHVVFAVIWIGGGTLLTVLALLAERSDDPGEMATIARQAAFVGERIFTPAGLIVLAMGIAMMVNGDLDWGQFWVVAALVGFAASFVTGAGFLGPESKRLKKLLAERGPADPETQARITRILLIARVDVAVLMLVVVDMVAKPFS